MLSSYKSVQACQTDLVDESLVGDPGPVLEGDVLHDDDATLEQ